MSLKNKELPLVSVAIVTYNQKLFLRESIESALIQDYPNIEIVVADDCSTDGTQEMLLDYEKKYPGKFKLVLGDKNLCVTGNANRAHFACTGKYVAWLGGDDLMLPGKLSKQVALMESDETITILYHDIDVFNSASGETICRFSDRMQPREGKIEELIKHGCFFSSTSIMARRSKLPKNGYNPLLPVASDYFYFLEAMENGGTIRYIPEVLGKYRRHSQNLTSLSLQVALDTMAVCNILLVRYPRYARYIRKMHMRAFLGLARRPEMSYSNTLLAAFLFHFSIKSLIAYCIYFVSFGRIKFLGSWEDT